MAKKTKDDPTGQRINRKRYAKRLAVRLTKAQRKVLAEFRSIPRKRKQQKIISNDSLKFYLYDFTGDALDSLRLSIQNYIDDELETTTDNMPDDWVFKQDIELPFRQGTVEELAVLNRTLSLTGLPFDPQSALFSPRYLDAVRQAQIRNYNLIKTLSEQTASQVLNEITNGIDAALTPTEISESVVERFNVSKSNAKRIADTEVNRAYTDAKLDAMELGDDREGVEIAALHISSLIPTTRPTHAARHNKLYTPAQQRIWWNKDKNRINCLCTVRSVLIDSSGNVLDSSLNKNFKDMRNA